MSKIGIRAARNTIAASVRAASDQNKIFARGFTDRMPAILEHDDWSIWLEEESAELDEVKSELRTMEHVRWTIAPELKKSKEKNSTRAKPEKPQPTLI